MHSAPNRFPHPVAVPALWARALPSPPLKEPTLPPSYEPALSNFSHPAESPLQLAEFRLQSSHFHRRLRLQAVYLTSFGFVETPASVVSSSLSFLFWWSLFAWSLSLLLCFFALALSLLLVLDTSLSGCWRTTDPPVGRQWRVYQEFAALNAGVDRRTVTCNAGSWSQRLVVPWRPLLFQSVQTYH